jgi:hypothetical protein
MRMGKRESPELSVVHPDVRSGLPVKDQFMQVQVTRLWRLVCLSFLLSEMSLQWNSQMMHAQ